jgi:hypothetical protein
VLAKKISNVGFEAIATVDRRPIGIDDLAPYPVFAPELVDFLRRAIPAARHDRVVWSVAVLACKPKGG